MTLRRAMEALLVLTALGAVAATACTSISNTAERDAVGALSVPISPSPSSSAASASSTSPVDESCNTSRTLTPLAPLPRPGTMPRGILRTIQRRGHLTVGVDLNTPLLSFQNPRTGILEGFEVDIAHAVARAIFGDDRNRVVFVPLTTAERQTAVESGHVDMVVDAFTITCDRMAVMAFSAPYFVAHQKLLVPSSSLVRGIGDLAGKRICATEGSTSSEIIAPAGARFVPVPTRIDCLVLLEEHRVDAITSDDAILAGLQSQDPLSKIVPLDAPASIEPPPGPYGIAIPKDPAHRQLVRFVNAVLARMGQDGEWNRLYGRWLRRPLNTSARQPPVTYEG